MSDWSQFNEYRNNEPLIFVEVNVVTCSVGAQTTGGVPLVVLGSPIAICGESDFLLKVLEDNHRALTFCVNLRVKVKK